ncbi:MAG: hypothetical protein K2Y23_21160 [Cyanobacteria bacterium]|nr:hypothetical protein [Cyanobacteriota bacterium]
MMIYPRADERAIRQRRTVRRWFANRLIDQSQRDRMLADLQVDYRRAKPLVRVALFVSVFTGIGGIIALLATTVNLREGFGLVLMFVAAGAFFLAEWLIRAFRFYRFGVEEAVAMSAAPLFAYGSTIFTSSGFSALRGFIALAGAAFIVFRRFGYVSAGVAAVILAAMIPFNVFVADTPRRLAAVTLLLIIFGVAGERRTDHGTEFPGDLYGVLETTAWAAMYVITNLEISQWLSIPDGYVQFQWATLAGIWILPAVGLFLAIRDRHRLMAEANIVMAIVTLLTTRPYLGAPHTAWDVIVLGLLMIAIAVWFRPKSPNHQITKSPDHQITRSTDQ